MANYQQLKTRLERLQKVVRPLNQSILGTSISFVHTAMLATLTQGPLGPAGVMVVSALSYPAFAHIVCTSALFVLPRIMPSDVRSEVLAQRQRLV